MTSRRQIGRTLQIAFVAVLAVVALGANNIASRFDKDSHAMMCTCGCEELLGECNHVGCPDSDKMRTELVAKLNQGESDDTIFREFQQEYGPVVLAAPMFTPFNHLAWIVPPLVLLLGIGAAMLFVRKWRVRVGPTVPRQKSAGQEALRNRIRRETQL